MSKFCTECGAENQDEAKFCVSCGNAFSESKSKSKSSVERASVENSIKNESKFKDSKSSFKEFYFSTQGRIGRREFFFRGFMPLTLLSVFVLFISNGFMIAESQLLQNMTYLVIALLITIGVSQVMISIKRFHDFNASGWWTILLFIPFANIIAMIVLFFKGSVNSENRYGIKVGFYKQTPMRWVLFVIQIILIFVLIILNGFAEIQYKNSLQDAKETLSSVVLKQDIYEKVAPVIKDKKLLVMEHNKKLGFIDKEGNWIIQPIYDDVDSFSEGLARVEMGEKWGFIDKEGNWIIQPIYDSVANFSEGLAGVKNMGESWGFIDKKGNLVIQPIDNRTIGYDGNGYGIGFREGLERAGFYLTKIEKDGSYFIKKDYFKWSFIDKKGNVAIPLNYDNVSNFSEGLAGVKNMGEKWGFIDKKGNWIIQPIYDDVDSFSEGLARVEMGEKWGFIDKKGNIVVQPIYNDTGSLYHGVDNFSDGLAKVKINKKWGFIDKKGNLVIQPMYDKTSHFSDGLAAVMINKKIFYINKKGEIAIKPKPIL